MPYKPRIPELRRSFMQGPTEPAPSLAVGLRAEVEKIRADYQSRMKFCDINPLPYYRDFVERLTRALSTPTSGEASAPPPLSDQHFTAGAGHAPGSAAESGAGAREDVERVKLVAKALAAHEYRRDHGKPMPDDYDGPPYSWADWIHDARAVVTALASSPTEQMREACRNILPYLEWTIGPESPGHHPTMPSAVAAFKEALGGNHD